MNDLTILFTVRIDSICRMNNLLATIKYYKTILPNSKIILLEADTASHLMDIVTHQIPYVDYIFFKDENPIFHRTKYINYQYRKVSTRYAAVIDADIIIPLTQIMASILLLRRCTQSALVYPYDGRFVGLDDYYSDLFRRNIDIDPLENVYGERNLMFGHISVGGAFIINVLQYKKMGWENEHFIGWGPEDFEREHRLDILGFRPHRIRGVIYHLNHERGVNSCNCIDYVVYTTKKEYCYICSLTQNQLKDYIKTWPWIK